MKIAHILYSGLGGHGSVFFSLARASSETPVEHIPVFFGIEPIRAEYEALCCELELDYRFVYKKPRAHLVPHFQLYKVLKELKANAVVIHSGASLPAAWLYSVTHKAPLIFVEHQANALKTQTEWVLSFLSLRLCHRVVYLSEPSLEEAKAKFGSLHPTSRTHVVPNGIDLQLFSPRPPKNIGNTITVGMAARMNALKDHESLLEMLSLEQTGRVKLRIAGDGPTMPNLKALSHKLGIEGRVTFLGMLDEQELLNFYHSLDVYVHSTFGETMSTSIMQAQACGLAVVASDVQGVNNQVDHGKDGLLVPAQDPKALHEALVLLTESPELKRSLELAAREKALKLYSHSRMRRGYDELVTGIAQSWAEAR